MLQACLHSSFKFKLPFKFVVACKRCAELVMHSIACVLLYEDYVWVSLGNAMKAKQNLKQATSYARS